MLALLVGLWKLYIRDPRSGLPHPADRQKHNYYPTVYGYYGSGTEPESAPLPAMRPRKETLQVQSKSSLLFRS